MKLNDPYIVERTMKTLKCEIEPMYWIVEDALHRGNRGKANAMLELLMYVGKYKPELIQNSLQPVQRSRLKEIVHEMYENVIIQKHEAITMKHSIQSSKIPFKLEKDLQNHLSEHKDILEDALGERLRIIGLEVETEDEYRCDIVAESAQKLYPIELKIDQSTHAVVSQCSKYCYYFYRKLRYNHFKNIQGIVLTNGADTWSINALRKAGHWIYIIRPDDSENIIALERIH